MAETLEHIQNAALMLFAQKGFYGTTIAEIAAAAHVGAGSIYRYYTSKEELVNDLFRHWKMAFVQAVTAGITLSDAAQVSFHQLWRNAITFACANREAMQFLELHHHAPYLDEESRAIENAMALPISGEIQQAKVRGELADYAEAMQRVIFKGIYMQLMREYWNGELELTESVIQATETLCWKALGGA